MRLCSYLGFLSGVLLLSVASLSHAQCSKDTDCKGERVCEAGACVAPAPLPPAPAAPGGAEPAPAAAGAAPAPAAQAAAVAPAPAPAAAPLAAAPTYEPPPEDEPVRLKPKRHSTGMMVGGIVMVSFVPIALLVSLVANAEQASCESGGFYYNTGDLSQYADSNCDKYDKTIYGGAIVALALAGAGIPLIAIGAKRQPVATARVTPWATPQAAGLKLRLEL